MGHTLRLPVEALQPYLLSWRLEAGGWRLEAEARNPKQKSDRLPPDSWLLTPDSFFLDWQTIFGNAQPVEIEVGFGKGLFLVQASGARPDTNFLGIEIDRTYQLFTANRLAKHARNNVRLACADARLFLHSAVASGSVQAVHVYFPDPWWKRRHRKRRLFTPEFAHECARVLCPGGRLYVASDVAEYFALIQSLLAQQTDLRPLPPEESNQAACECPTNFERKYRQEGRPIQRTVYGKKW